MRDNSFLGLGGKCAFMDREHMALIITQSFAIRVLGGPSCACLMVWLPFRHGTFILWDRKLNQISQTTIR